MLLRDSRRLTGPNLLSDRAGAVIEATLDGEDAARLVEAWRAEARRMLEAVGWPAEETRARAFPGGVILALSAPVDTLYAATEVNEWAWEAAAATLAGSAPPPFEQAVSRLRDTIAAERKPRLIALQAAAAEREVAFVADHQMVSVGLGAGSRSWRIEELPRVEAVDWSTVRDIPVALITGTNGKSTTVRLLAEMAQAAGLTPGTSSTDGVRVGDAEVTRGDYSGPGGARTVLRDRRVEQAVLETARGGILRRGLAVRRAQAAVVTNVADDHIGEFGIHDLDALAETKLVVARAIGPDGRLVLNADDGRLRAHAARVRAPLAWFSVDPDRTALRSHVAAGGDACWLEDGMLLAARAGRRTPVVHEREVPITFGGAARHNVANALAAIAAGLAIGLPVAAIAAGLRRFESTPERNPGRANLWELGGVRILVDFAHNPHGLRALARMAAAMPAARRLLLVGQAGDRSDEDVRELARTGWSMRPDRVILKELPEILRGRELGEVPALMESALREAGAPPDRIARAASEGEGVRAALAWAQPGDLLVLLIHVERRAVTRLLEDLRARAWSAGEPIHA
jgi:UDP-N-acetylmuramyl tripeptide synthase